ncbi:MAG: iron-containing alcohol dehydrogenase [Isosphaeraceae bacterium]|nr:iron-containing alcohol dehydrogenase [Isosphaeraceae bacterium]
MISTFTFPNRVLFGEGARSSIPAELARLGISRPLVVTDRGLLTSGTLDALLRDLGSDVAVFADVQPNPTEADVLGALESYRDRGRDGILGIGGGSPIDAAKAVRLLATHPGKLADYDLTTGGTDRIGPDLPPMIAVPTTAGTGTEAGRGTLIQLPETGRKTIALSQFLLPTLAVCDPELTLSLPPTLTAGTGMDAFTHCVESYLSTTFHPICDGIALEGLRRIAKGLETSVHDGRNLKARIDCMLGALLGGISFHKGLGVVHSLSHALGSEGRAHHGTLNAVLLPHALRFNREAAELRMIGLAGAIGLGRNGDAASHLIVMAELMLRKLPLPRTLGEIEGLDRARIDHYARLAMIDHCHKTNPRPCTLQDMEDLLDRAW